MLMENSILRYDSETNSSAFKKIIICTLQTIYTLARDSKNEISEEQGLRIK